MDEKIYLIVGTSKDTEWGDVDFIEDWFATNEEANEYMEEYRKDNPIFRVEDVCKINWIEFIKDNDKYGWY